MKRCETAVVSKMTSHESVAAAKSSLPILDASGYKDLMPPRKRNLFDPTSTEPFRVSRSKIDLFLKCARCFYLDRRLGISQPSSPPFSLNSAVDELLKREFDQCRAAQKPHRLMTENGIDAVPFQHADLETWRDSLRKGITYPFPNTTLIITGGVDDVWVTPRGELLIVDYKATSKNGEVSLDADWQIAYKRQVEIYQWLFRKNGFKVSDTAYFVYCNGDKDRPSFDGRLDFSIKVIPYEGNASWIDGTLSQLFETLKAPALPVPSPDCEHCAYRSQASKVEIW